MVTTSSAMGDAGVNKNPSQGKFKSATYRPAKPGKSSGAKNPLQSGKVKRKNNGQNKVEGR